MNDYELGYGNGGSLWDGIINAATAATGVVNALKDKSGTTTPPGSTKPLPLNGSGVPWYVWAGAGLLAVLVAVLALRK